MGERWIERRWWEAVTVVLAINSVVFGFLFGSQFRWAVAAGFAPGLLLLIGLRLRQQNRGPGYSPNHRFEHGGCCGVLDDLPGCSCTRDRHRWILDRQDRPKLIRNHRRPAGLGTNRHHENVPLWAGVVVPGRGGKVVCWCGFWEVGCSGRALTHSRLGRPARQEPTRPGIPPATPSAMSCAGPTIPVTWMRMVVATSQAGTISHWKRATSPRLGVQHSSQLRVHPHQTDLRVAHKCRCGRALLME